MDSSVQDNPTAPSPRQYSARMQRPSFGHENKHFRENQAKTLVFIPNLAQRHR